MKTMIVGANGQLGTALKELTGESAISLGRQDLDITSLESISKQLDTAQPTAVINCAAYNLVDQAEDEPDVAFNVNALGPRNLAIECQKHDICLLHVSTDYVFGLDTSSRPWTECDTPGPVSAYGTSKLAGEYFVRSLCSKHFVVRTCGLYGHAARRGAGKGNFVETMLRLGNERDELRIIDDQQCVPTNVKDLAIAICELARTTSFGLYHATNQGTATWARFAEEIFSYSKMPTQVVRIPSVEYPTKAQRPSKSLLDCSKLETVLQQPMRDWQTALHEYLDERAESPFPQPIKGETEELGHLG